MASVVETPVEEIKPQKKEVEILKVLAEKVRGHVKWYSVARRYGFISRNDDGGDLFVHRSVISAYSRRFPSLRSGEEVEFNVVETNHGLEAVYVTGPGGQPVKGIRPMIRRYRTTSEPNGDGHPQGQPLYSSEVENARPRQGGRRPRGPRQPANRVRSAGANEPRKTDAAESAEAAKTEGNGSPQEDGEQPVGDGQSPNHTVPRQRRRPQRRTPRHRSAPDVDSTDIVNGDHNARLPTARYENRGQGRPFRRAFRQRGGFRYANGYSQFPHVVGYPGGPTPYQNRFRPAGGFRDGFEHGPRRRGFGGGHPRGSRRKQPPSGDQAAPVNGEPGANKKEKPVGMNLSEEGERPFETNDVSKEELVASPSKQRSSDESGTPKALPDTTSASQETDMEPTAKKTESSPKEAEVNNLTEGVQQVKLQDEPVTTTSNVLENAVEQDL